MVLVDKIVRSARKYHLFSTSVNVYNSILARLQVEVLDKSFALYNLLHYFVPSHPVFPPFCHKERIRCF